MTEFLSRLDGLQGRGPRWRAVCPAHVSKHRSRTLSIYEPEPERLLLHCHAGCDVESIVRAIGLELNALFPICIDAHKNKTALQKPWRASDVAKALEAEAEVAWILLRDLADGKAITFIDRQRAGIAAQRCLTLIHELTHAH